MSDFTELFAEGVDKVTDKYWDRGYDKLHGASRRNRRREDDENERHHRQDSDMDQDPRRRYPARTPPPPRNRYDDSSSDEDDYPRERRGPAPRYNDGDYRRRGRDDLPPPSDPRDAAPYAAAGAAATGNAVAPYARSNRYPSASRSRSRRRRRDRSYSRSRSRPRSNYSNHRDDGRGIEATIKEQLEKNFDTSTQGLGAGLAGAAIGGWLGSRYGNEHGRGRDQHKERNIAAGAVVGGLAVNFLENQYMEYRNRKNGGGGFERDARKAERFGRSGSRSRERSRRRRSR